MTQSWVVVKGEKNEFYIVDSILTNGSTYYLGYFDGSKDLEIISPAMIKSFGKKLRAQI